MLDNKNIKMFLYNYYISNGSFMNLSKNAPSIYRKILNQKKEENGNDVTVTKYLEDKLLPYKKEETIDSSYIRNLYEHYSKDSSLVGTEVSKELERNLTETAKEMNIKVEKVKEMFDNKELYPRLTSRIIEKVDIRDYNNIMTVIGLRLIMDTQVNSNIKLEWFHDFDDFDHLKYYEPSYATYLESKVPKYAGPIVGDSSLTFKIEGSKYYGKNLNLESVPSLMNDVFFTLKGYSSNKNLTPTVYYKLIKMNQVSGNLNRIGLDNLDLLKDLDELSMNLGFTTIQAMLKEENFKFEPITAEKVNFIDSGDAVEIILEDYEGGQIMAEPILQKYLTDMKVLDTIEVVELQYKGVPTPLLTYVYDGKVQLVHSLITKSKNKIYFKDKNPLNLRATNL